MSSRTAADRRSSAYVRRPSRQNRLIPARSSAVAQAQHSIKQRRDGDLRPLTSLLIPAFAGLLLSRFIDGKGRTGYFLQPRLPGLETMGTRFRSYLTYLYACSHHAGGLLGCALLCASHCESLAGEAISQALGPSLSCGCTGSQLRCINGNIISSSGRANQHRQAALSSLQWQCHHPCGSSKVDPAQQGSSQAVDKDGE